MTFQSIYNKQSLKLYLTTLIALCYATHLLSQKPKVDSLIKLLATEKVDTNRVTLMWTIARDISVYNPDTALLLSQDALYLAKNLNYVEGESRSLGILANTFMKIGNYSRALELNFQKLQLEEKRESPRSLASVLMNIGIVYVFQEEYSKALEYYSKADSVITKYNVEDFKYNIALNIGDVYNRLDYSDSAYLYFNRSLEIAKIRSDGDLIGTSMTGLGHTYMKLKNYVASLLNYQNAIKLLQEAEDDETLCEASLGIAKLYDNLNQSDSAHQYASLSLSVAKKDGFLSKELEAAEFLTKHYKKIRNIDRAFIYAEYSHQLNDSLNSKTKIRQLQILSSNEQFRQRELEEERISAVKKLEEERKIATKKRYKQLQLLLIGMFIPSLFLITLLLNRQKIHIRVIRMLGVLSLLFLFEYLTLLLHPTVAELTDHNPIFEIMIFVGIAAILIPVHHRTEHWLIHRLIHHRVHYGQPDKLNKTNQEDKKNSPA